MSINFEICFLALFYRMTPLDKISSSKSFREFIDNEQNVFDTELISFLWLKIK